MKNLVLLLLLAAGPALADPAETLCATNPAFSPDVMLKVVLVQLQGEHDPALDADTPEHIANQAVTQGVGECADEVRSDPSITTALNGLAGPDLTAGWDAFNTACADHKESRGACISAEVGAGKALKDMTAHDRPAGAKTLVQTCELVMKATPGLAEWRECVDQGLAVPRRVPRDGARCRRHGMWRKMGQRPGGLFRRACAGADMGAVGSRIACGLRRQAER
jgi:hypothetical protein